MERVTEAERLNNYLEVNDMVVVYFNGSTCGACEIIQAKVESILKRFPHVRGIQVNGVECPALAASYQVFSLPLFILYVQGKEVVREGRNVDLLAFEERLERYTALIQ